MREVVFDIGNVLLRWDPRNLYTRVFDDPAEMKRFLKSALTMSFIVETDVTPRFADTVEAQILRFPEFERELRMFDARWLETLAGPIEENVALMQRLRAQGRRVHALSNFAHEKFALALAAYPFLGEFDVAVISGHVGVAKPDRRIFEILLERVGRPAGDLVFVDDSPKNVEAARAFGIEAILYAPGLDLARELASRGAL
jgi:HAD superfamily hydrolase (TIGR01509 family)